MNTVIKTSSMQTIFFTVKPYVKIARPDHWFKNVFIVPGMIVAIFDDPSLLTWDVSRSILLAVLSACLVSSSNYVINEILDAPTDSHHPQKKFRPIPSGQVILSLAYLEWIGLGILGIIMASFVNRGFLYASLLLLFMGIAYNVPPVRLKDLVYLDVLSESFNNPIRLLMGWYSVENTNMIMLSLVMSYWMLGAFLMAVKRYAEYNYIGSKETALNYRKSFSHYTKNRLLTSIIYYATAFGLFSGIFVVRYHIELILCVPFVAGFISYYLHLGFYENSPVQYPERLYKHRLFALYTTLCFILIVLLLFTNISWISNFFQGHPK